MAKRKELHLLVITPERQVLDETTDALVVIPAHDGELGILPGRAPLLCELGIGQMRYQKAGVTKRLLIDGGFAQVVDDNVTVLTDRAIPAPELTDEVLRSAERELESARGTDPEVIDIRRKARRRVSVMRNLRRRPA